MPITMLHGPYGIGTLGSEAYEFVDFLKAAGFSAWQVLPVERVGAGFSPYSGVSSFAGEPMMIDPTMLLDMELITQKDIDERCADMNVNEVNYELVVHKQQKVLWKAYSKLEDRIYLKYKPPWLSDYTTYMAIKQHFDKKPWYQWPHAALKNRDKTELRRACAELNAEIEFHSFCQWLFDRQWKKLKAYCAKSGISVIGDMPYYVSADSAEVWTRRELFDADDNGVVPAVGGAPPDYFMSEGQCWGTPVYNWTKMKAEGYKWWINRIKGALERYDVLRLDHFRGFESFWRIPSSTGNARDGAWKKGPGMAFFKALKEELGDLPIIAEDLGDIDEPVEKLLEKTGFRGMSIVQFGFLGDKRHLPHRLSEAKIAYTGTHDNTTLLAWMYEMREEERNEALFYLGFKGDWGAGGSKSEINKAWIRELYTSAASMVIVPVQDLLGYGADTRTNIPGTPDGNWKFRIRAEALREIDTAFYRALGEATERT